MTELHRALAAADPDGGLPHELGRGPRALQYQCFAMLAISLLVAQADANGVKLAPSEEQKLQSMARFTQRAFADPGWLAKRIGSEQIKAKDLAAWMEVLQPHFKTSAPDLATLLETTAAPLRPVEAKVVGLPASALIAP
jgi:hypothetical protein